MRLSVVLPTYNERSNIGPLVARVDRALGGRDYELIFVDDSTDGTDAAIAEQARHSPRIVLLHRTRRRGLASAVVDGFRRAAGEVVCVLDADLQHPPELIPALLEALETTGADVAVASRNIRGGGYEAFSRARRLASRIASWLAWALLRRARLVSDPMSGFFAVRTRVIQDVPLRPLGYKILLEILVRGRLRHVAEVPYRFRARVGGQSKLTARQHGEYLRHLLRLVTVQPEDLRFVRFCGVGASGVLINTGVLWALTGRGLYYLWAGIAAAVTATTWNFLLNDAFTWKERRSPALPVKARRYVRYWMVTGTASVVQLAILFLLTTAGLPYLLANLTGIAAASVWNFAANGRWTWERAEPPVVRTICRPHPSDAPEAIEPAGVRG